MLCRSSDVPVGPATGLDHDGVVSGDTILTVPVTALGQQIGLLLAAQKTASIAAIRAAVDLDNRCPTIIWYETLQTVVQFDPVATVSMSTARETFPDVVELAQTEAVILERYGRPAAVLLSPEQYERMRAALDEAEDAAAFDAALAEDGPNIPWEQVKADLGWA